MKLEKRINLCLYGVELYDVRQAKPRTPIDDSIVIDGGRISAERAGVHHRPVRGPGLRGGEYPQAERFHSQRRFGRVMA